MQLRADLIKSTERRWATYHSHSALKDRIGLKEVVQREISGFAKKFSDSSFNSIDNFLNVNQEYALVGKLAILLAICDAERFAKFREDLNDYSADWLFWLFNKSIAPAILSSDPGKALEQIQLRFITFNYDRTLEWFLSHSIMSAIPGGSARENFKERLQSFEFLDVIHMYGRLAPLPFQEKSETFPFVKTNLPVLPFGVIPIDSWEPYAQNISLIGERLMAQKDRIAEIFRWADDIFFLGFGFDDQNIIALDFEKNLLAKHTVHATCYQLVEREVNDIQEKILRNRVPRENIAMCVDGILPTLRKHMAL